MLFDHCHQRRQDSSQQLISLLAQSNAGGGLFQTPPRTPLVRQQQSAQPPPPKIAIIPGGAIVDGSSETASNDDGTAAKPGLGSTDAVVVSADLDQQLVDGTKQQQHIDGTVPFPVDVDEEVEKNPCRPLRRQIAVRKKRSFSLVPANELVAAGNHGGGGAIGDGDAVVSVADNFLDDNDLLRYYGGEEFPANNNGIGNGSIMQFRHFPLPAGCGGNSAAAENVTAQLNETMTFLRNYKKVKLIELYRSKLELAERRRLLRRGHNGEDGNNQVRDMLRF